MNLMSPMFIHEAINMHQKYIIYSIVQGELTEIRCGQFLLLLSSVYTDYMWLKVVNQIPIPITKFPQVINFTQ